MKKYEAISTTLAFVFSLNCFAQRTENASDTSVKGNTVLLTDNLADSDLVIKSYYVEERINKLFGGRIITYEVSKLEMVDTYDLGPNNTRTIIPRYVKRKQKVITNAIPAITPVQSTVDSVVPIEVEIAASKEKTKYVDIDLVNTYETVIGKGYKSVEMLRKVADKQYFDGNLIAAACYYAQLFELTTDLDVVYYYRYAQSLKAINESEKADALMKRFTIEILAAK